MFDLVLAHSPFLGHTGFNAHSCGFFTALSQLINLRVKNFTYTDDLSYLTQEQKDLLVYQIWAGPPYEVGKPLNINEYTDVLNIVLSETNHTLFYENFNGPKISYNVWESTRQPEQFFNQLLKFDQLWVPTEWQKTCSIEQGYPKDKVFVVPEAVNTEFYPEDVVNKPEDYNDDRFKFLVFGRWDYRKSITEIIRAFLQEFRKNEPVDIIISVDNPFFVDGLKTTNERLQHHKFVDDRIKIKHFVPWADYVKYIKSGHCFVSCARSEGWNIPLIEAMAAGTPAIYSDWGAQLEFAGGLGFPVKIIGEVPARFGEGSSFSGNIPGNYCEPDFNDLQKVMRSVYKNYGLCKSKAVKESKIIRSKYTWENAAQTAFDIITKFWKSHYLPHNVSTDGKSLNFTWKGKSGKEVIGKIIDNYTGLGYYKCDFNLSNNTSYYISHGYDTKNKLFKLYDKETNELLLEALNTNGKFDLSKLDKNGYLKNYFSLLPNDFTSALPLYEIFVDEIYNYGQCRINNGDVVVDVGANLGFFSVYASYKGCKVCYAFEPIKELYASMKIQIDKIPNIVIDNRALSNFTGESKFYIPVNESIGASLYDTSKKYNKEQTIVKCDVVDFMEMIYEKGIEKIDYLKLDCEGAEYDIFKSITDEFLTNSIKKIAMEFHDNHASKLQTIIDRLEASKFHVEFKENANINSDLGILYAWKKFDFSLFIKPYEDDLKRTGKSRYNFYEYVIPKLVAKQKPLCIIETGTMWSDLKDNMGAFTLVFSDLIKNWTGGKLVTIDISKENLNKCKETTKKFSDVIDYVNSDSVQYLKLLPDNDVSKVDLFYFDSYDLNVTNQDPSAKHHLMELEAVYNRLADDVIIAVDDNFLPGTEIQWHWLNNDGSIRETELVNTKESIIGKGSLINEFLLRRSWKRIFEFDIATENNVFYYERQKFSKEQVSNILNDFFLSKSTTKTKSKPFDHKAITNSSMGLGDTIILTPFTANKLVSSESTSFPTLMFYNKNFKNPLVVDDFQGGFIDISEYAKYNWGGGHAIQRIARVLGLAEMPKPKGIIDIKNAVVKNKIGYHINRDSNPHTLSDFDLNTFNEFVVSNDYEFCDLSYFTKNNNLRGLIETLATCEYFIGINSGPMHVAAALGIKSIVIVNEPSYSELYLPRISEVEIKELEWLYPQNVHLHTKGSNELVPKFNKVNLERAVKGGVYPYWRDDYLEIPEDLTKLTYKIDMNFIDGPFVEIKGNDRASFKIDFIDEKTADVVHSDTILVNHWTKAYRKYFTDWGVKIYRSNELVNNYRLDLSNQRVYIHLDSKSIGDTLAWFPYIEEFRKTHNCHVICSTFWNNLFIKEYKEIDFVQPGSVVDNIMAMYTVGWWDKDIDDGYLRLSNPRTKPLQQTASDILGLPYKEVIPKISVRDKARPIDEKYVCIATVSTAACKLWLRDNGWQSVINYLNDLGYKVVVVQKEPTDLKNVIDKTGKDDLQISIGYINSCEFFIGLASGLSWIAWALEKKSIMIAGFTDTYTEYQTNCFRVINKDVCYGCWNDPTAYPFDKSWNWCPRQKNFECSRSITPEMVIKEIDVLRLNL